MQKYKIDCRFFNGYKPCKPGKLCLDCKDYSPIGKRILIINLDQLGDVLRTTAMLYPLKRKYNRSQITWITEKAALPLLDNNPYIDRAFDYSYENILALLAEEFDCLMNVDKGRRSCALANLIKAEEKFGFALAKNGVIVPFNKEAEALYELGLDDEKKFKVNKTSEQELLCRTMGLEYERDEYILNLTDEEKSFKESYREKLGLNGTDKLIGFNTGCSHLYPYKKMAYNKQIELIEGLLSSANGAKVALLGGREDTENNSRLKGLFKDRIISTPTDMGLRKGILFVDSCDIIITGDTLALHIAIALKKPVVAWFSISCENEIDLYGRGIKVVSDVGCRPCWKRDCSNLIRCNETIDIVRICSLAESLLRGMKIEV